MDKEIKVVDLEVTKYYVYANRLPGVVLIDKSTGKELGYLSAFRDYKFQVSGTFDGESDEGSTPVFGLKTFSSIIQQGPSNLGQESTVKLFIEALARYAIQDFCNRHRHYYDYYDEEGNPKIIFRFPPNLECGTFNCNNPWQSFIDACYERYYLGYDTIEGPEYDDVR